MKLLTGYLNIREHLVMFSVMVIETMDENVAAQYYHRDIYVKKR